MAQTPLQRTGLLDTPPEEVFDHFTNLVSKVLRTPVALISLVDLKRQFFKSQIGLGEPLASQRETPLASSICKHVTASGKPLIVEDARTNDLVKDNPAVREIGVVAYAGVPLHDDENNALGALCAIDFKPRVWTHHELEVLEVIARQISAEFALRAEVRRQGLDLAALREAETNRRFASRADRHDLRTPLNALLLSVSAIPQLGSLNPDQEEFLQVAIKNGRSLTAMIDKLLDIGNVDAHGHDALSLADCLPFELVSRAIEQVVTLAQGKGVSLFRSAGAPREIRADADKIVRVLVNLIANAIKFTPPGGKITVSVEEGLQGDTPATIFSIEDTGSGIPEEALPLVFVDGFRVEKDAPTSRSTGLGLTFCKKIVEAHGGSIAIESRLGSGSTFTFSVPATL